MRKPLAEGGEGGEGGDLEVGKGGDLEVGKGGEGRELETVGWPRLVSAWSWFLPPVESAPGLSASRV